MKSIRFWLIALMFLFGVFMLTSSSLAVCTGETPCLKNPLDTAGIDSFQGLIGRVINSILGVVGSLALVMFIYGGLIWMTSSGSSDKVKKGRDILIWAAIGLVIIFSAYGLVRFVIVGIGAGS
jgi:hypothetical protein